MFNRKTYLYNLIRQCHQNSRAVHHRGTILEYRYHPDIEILNGWFEIFPKIFLRKIENSKKKEKIESTRLNFQIFGYKTLKPSLVDCIFEYSYLHQNSQYSRCAHHTSNDLECTDHCCT